MPPKYSKPQPPGKKGPPGQKAGSSKTTPQTATTKKPSAPKTEEKKCPRCVRAMDPTGDGIFHKLSKCPDGAKFSTDDYIPKLWSGYELGDKARDMIKSKQDAQNLMNLMPHSKPTQFEGQPVTKFLLEHAFQAVYTTDRMQNLPPTTPRTGPTAGQSSTAARAGPSGSTGNSSRPSTSATQPPQKTAENGKLILSKPPQVPQRKSEPHYSFAVHKEPNLDGRFSTDSDSPNTPYGAHKVSVATNYVAVNKVPAKIHMYSISYGQTERMRTKKEIEADSKVADDAKKLATEDAKLRKAMADLSTADNNDGGTDGGSTDSGGGRAVAQRSEKARIFKALAKRDEFSGVRWATDYTLLWTLDVLQHNTSSECTITAIEYAKLSGRQHKLDTITFKYIQPIDLDPRPAEASKLLLDKVPHPDYPSDVQKGAGMRITALNAFISKQVMSTSTIIPVGPNKFFVRDDWKDVPLSYIFNIRRGYFTSIRPGSSSVLLNVNVATSAFYESRLVSDFFKQSNSSEDAEKDLKGLTVFIGYERFQHDSEYNPNDIDNRHRVVAGFGDPPAQQTFQRDDGTTTTVLEYFRELGHVVVQHPDLPCISVNVAPPSRDKKNDNDQQSHKGKGKKKQDKPRPKILWILPELLYISPYQPYAKLLPSALTEHMIKAAVRPPAKTQNMIMDEGFKLLGIGETPSPFQPLELDIGTQLVKIPGYLLQPPKIAYSGSNILTVENASWNLKGVKFFQPPQVSNSPSGSRAVAYPLQRAICTIDTRSYVKHQGLTGLGKQLSQHLKAHGLEFDGSAMNKHVYLDLHTAIDRQQQDLSDDVKFHNALTGFLQGKADIGLAVVILARKEIHLYGVIKRICDQWLGLHTACLVEEKQLKTVHGGKVIQNLVSPQQKSNLALKFNMKLRGQNHQLLEPKSNVSFFHDIADDTIVFGADVSHAGGTMPFTPSVAAVVANDDRDFAHFPASMRLQASNQEMIQDLEDMVYHRLLRFRDYRGYMPRRIIFFRDGVSEDQFAMCRRDEISGIRDAYQRVFDTAGPGNGREGDHPKSADEMQLTFVVVGKRHHTRFFAIREEDTYGDSSRAGQGKWEPEMQLNQYGEEVEVNKLNGNVKAGLLIDQVITRPADDPIKDFFLQSHAALQGTARAGHYSVLEHGAFTLDEIKSFTHAFCYNYMRATKGVSYVGPAYYADRLCERGTIYLKGYTAGLTQAPLQITDEEKNDKKEGAKAFAARIAEYITETREWIPSYDETDEDREPNPWHPSFDNCMFWLPVKLAAFFDLY